MEWTNIEPRELEALGFVDMYEEDEHGVGNGHLAEWELRDLPEGIDYLYANFLASDWELVFCADNGDETVYVRTRDEFNNVMRRLGLKCELR